MQTIVEIVIFLVKPYRLDEFREAMKLWVSHIKEQPGFVSYSYLRSLNNPSILFQILEFQYKFVAQDVLEKYREKIGDEKFQRFFHLLQKKPTIEYYEKIDFLNEAPAVIDHKEPLEPLPGEEPEEEQF
ncbi:MAG: hypothetical protein RDV48_26875 [Candidatus Eremiobacteraeota bacterium]|nr:hypothetical protein [Candidatus Eremiobacteraeota bacterium]